MGARKQEHGLDFRHVHYVPQPKTFIPAPNGLMTFGSVPRIRMRTGEVIETGDILLRFGEHWGPNWGYGVYHILQEHPSLAQANPSAILSVAQFVANVIQPSAHIHCEFANMRGNHRPIVIKRPHGQVVLEPRDDAVLGIYYSVVTAIPSTKANGPLIGAI